MDLDNGTGNVVDSGNGGASDNDFDMAAALGELSDGLGFGQGENHNNDDVDFKVEEKPQVVAPAAKETLTPPAEGTLPTADTPPKTWRPEASAVWATIPEAARAEILKREEDIFKGIESYKEDANFGKTFKNTLAPWLPTLQQYGIDPVQQVSGLMQAHHTLALGTQEAKLELFQRMAKDYRVDLSQLTDLLGEAPYVDPAVRTLQSQLDAVNSKISAAETAQQAARHQEMVKQVELFAADPANIYFNDVANDMTALLGAKICATLPEAYEQAIWRNPVTRAKEITRQQTIEAEKQAGIAEARRIAAQKATAANVRTSAKSGSATTPLGTMDDTLNETLAAIQSRA